MRLINQDIGMDFFLLEMILDVERVIGSPENPDSAETEENRIPIAAVRDKKGAAFATAQYGLTAQQLGDAFKDAKERVGDFINTGGGPLQDFADAMGMTSQATMEFARSVEDLSGRDVLIRMVDEMEAAGLSGDQMSHALEGMANDMTLLLPLLLWDKQYTFQIPS